jgi:hypothetical protein
MNPTKESYKQLYEFININNYIYLELPGANNKQLY